MRKGKVQASQKENIDRYAVQVNFYFSCRKYSNFQQLWPIACYSTHKLPAIPNWLASQRQDVWCDKHFADTVANMMRKKTWWTENG
jgi:hypothetical protein